MFVYLCLPLTWIEKTFVVKTECVVTNIKRLIKYLYLIFGITLIWLNRFIDDRHFSYIFLWTIAIQGT